jgi:ABC-type Fe3+ transport system permease subunit
MDRTVLYVRLIIGALAATGSAAFVALYTPTAMEAARGRLDYMVQIDRFPKLTLWVAGLTWKPLLIPAVLLALGLLILYRRKSMVAFELVVGAQWLFALLWLAYCLFVCLLPEIPNMSPVGVPERHFYP